MIVPRDRLLWLVGLGAVPAALAAAVAPPAAPLLYALMALAAVVIVVDAAGAWPRAGGIGVDCPSPSRLAKDRAGAVSLRLTHAGSGPREVRLGLPWPAELRPEAQEMLVALPGGAEASRVDWPLTPLARGRFVLDRCYVEARSRLGLWSARRSVAARVEVRVYPNLLTERKTLAALVLRRGAIGLHAQRQVGKGRDFEKLREYIAGDGYDDIHWKATAKRGRPVTKVFQIERTQEVYVVLDTSRLSARRPGEAAGGSTVLERFLTAGMVLALAAQRQGDRFGFVTFSDRVERFVPARGGRAHYAACRDALYTAQPRIVTPDFDELCTFLRLHQRRRALLVILTSLDDPILAESFTRSVRVISRHHLVLVNVLRTPGVGELFSEAGAAGVRDDDDLYAALGGHLRCQQLLELARRLRRQGVGLAQLANENLSAQLVSQYMGIKQRQLL